MDHESPPDESCTPQHFTTRCPTNEWLPEQLCTYAQAQHQAILDDERHLAVKYWRLGRALDLLRRSFNHGQWAQLLTQLDIEKTKASRARAIARTFEKEDELAGLTVKQAYDKRPRKLRKPAPEQSKPKQETGKLGRFLDHVTKTADLFVDEAGFAEEAEAMALLPAIEAAMQKLEQIRVLLRQQAHIRST
jgi:hypothetical protein